MPHIRSDSAAPKQLQLQSHHSSWDAVHRANAFHSLTVALSSCGCTRWFYLGLAVLTHTAALPPAAPPEWLTDSPSCSRSPVVTFHFLEGKSLLLLQRLPTQQVARAPRIRDLLMLTHELLFFGICLCIQDTEVKG